MKKNTKISFKLWQLVLLGIPFFANAQDFKIEEIKGRLIYEIHNLKTAESPKLGKHVNPRHKSTLKTIPSYRQTLERDPALQSSVPTTSARTEASLGLKITGLIDVPSVDDPDGTNVPDPTVAVGPNHILQMCNGTGGSHLKIWNKSGTVLLAEKNYDVITGRGGYCDPIALYDHLADRYFMSEMTASEENGGNDGLVISISKTADPTGGWYSYYFSFGTEQVDYPKYSVWNDAYYGAVNHQGTDGNWNVSALYAFNRTQMLAGAASPNMQRVFLPQSLKAYSAAPVLWQGNTQPPAGTGGLFAVMQDDAWTASTSDKDSIGIYEFDVNFSNATLSKLTQVSSLAVATFKANICDTEFGYCIDQVNGEYPYLQATQNRVMNQPIYRNFGTHQGIVMTHVVDKGSTISGVRWYELRKTTGNWSVYQQSTYGPDSRHRFLPTMAYDATGNIALGYNTSSATEFTSLRYTGRKSCDPLNTMTYAETIVVASTKVHSADNAKRYGDYNHMIADPLGASFWFTGEYDDVASPSNNWSTKIVNFTLDNCTTGTCTNNYESNDTRATATVFPVNTTINSMIQTSTDNDYFKFNNTSSASNIRVTLSNLPADYDLELYRNGSTSVQKSSKHSGLGNEVFYLNTSTIAQFEVRVFPRSGGFSASSCYSLKVELSNTSFSSAKVDETYVLGESAGISAYPVPADDKLNVDYYVTMSGPVNISLLTISGVLVVNKQVNAQEGSNQEVLDVKAVPNGVYLLKVEQNGLRKTMQVTLNH